LKARLRSENVPAGNASVPLRAAVNGLQARLEELEAAVDAVRAGVAAARATLDACRLVSGGTDTASENGGETSDAQALWPAASLRRAKRGAP
jgi:hypothetical protein